MGMVETELFAQTYKSYSLATVRYPVLEIEARAQRQLERRWQRIVVVEQARVEPFENGQGFSLRVCCLASRRATQTADNHVINAQCSLRISWQISAFDGLHACFRVTHAGSGAGRGRCRDLLQLLRCQLDAPAEGAGNGGEKQ